MFSDALEVFAEVFDSIFGCWSSSPGISPVMVYVPRAVPSPMLNLWGIAARKVKLPVATGPLSWATTGKVTS